MNINGTTASVLLTAILYGATVTWAFSAMSISIEYNARAILEIRQDSSKTAAEIHANQLTLTRIDTSLKAINEKIALIVD